MKPLALSLAVMFGFLVAFTFGTPSSPQPLTQNPEYAHFSIDVHNRDSINLVPMAAQHGSACQAPPATHTVSTYEGTVYVCNGHVMTAINSGEGYAMAAITPSQLLNCSTSCTVQFELSTEKQSLRDWPDIWLQPWNDNLTLPFGPEAGEVDLQGVPLQGLYITANNGQSGWRVNTIANGVVSELCGFDSVQCDFWSGMSDGIAAGTNQAATRQTYKLTLTPGHVKFERLASATASGKVWIDKNCTCLMAPDYVVTFAHHSYNPTKPDHNGIPSGVPATWHWFGPDGLTLSPSVPFTLIHSTPRMVTTDNTLVTFDAPAPANAYLRFSGLCRVKIDGEVAAKQRFTGHVEHVSSYFVPIAQGKQSVTVSFETEAGCGGFRAHDFVIWSKTGGAPSAPTPTPIIPTATPQATSTPAPTATFTPVVPSPTATATPVAPTSTPSPSPTATPNPNRRMCYESLDSGITIVRVAC